MDALVQLGGLWIPRGSRCLGKRAEEFRQEEGRPQRQPCNHSRDLVLITVFETLKIGICASLETS